MVAADAAADARLARIAGQREHKGEIVAKAEWKAIISKADSAKIRAKLADPERRTNRSARRYLLDAAADVRQLWRAAGRASAQRRAAPVCVCDAARASPGAGTCTSAPTRSEAWVLDACFYRLDSPELAAAIDRRNSDQPGSGALAAGSRRRRTRSWKNSRRLRATREITMAEWRAAREPIEKRQTAARKQLAKATRTTVFDGYVGNAAALRARVGRARPHPPARDRRGDRRSRHRRPRPPRLQPLRRVTSAAVLAALSGTLAE